MYIDSIEKQLKEMIKLKKDNDYRNYNVRELGDLISYNGIWELKFRDNIIKMLNIFNDDLVALKYFWREKYEQLSLNLWYEFKGHRWQLILIINESEPLLILSHCL